MSARIVRAPRIVGRRIGGQWVLVALPSLETRVLNDVGARVWELAEGRHEDEIARVLSEELEAPQDEVARDVADFVSALVADGFLSREAERGANDAGDDARVGERVGARDEPDRGQGRE